MERDWSALAKRAGDMGVVSAEEDIVGLGAQRAADVCIRELDLQ